MTTRNRRRMLLRILASDPFVTTAEAGRQLGLPGDPAGSPDPPGDRPPEFDPTAVASDDSQNREPRFPKR